MSNNTPNSAQQAAPLMDSYQPTVRVMRLYKPGFHLVQSFPHVPHTFSPGNFDLSKSNASDFTLSPFLLLPDSFGDIYAGEKFSAYIAVVNGFAQVPFYQVTLAVRLQTATTVIDLADTRASAEIAGSNQYLSKTLSCNETFDMIVSQTLNELGIHTLRVSVQYLHSPTGEVKTLRKFYRFNVLQPLVIQSSYVELNGKPMVQCEVTNATKSPIYIDELAFIPTNRTSVCQAITGNRNQGQTDASSRDALVETDASLTEDLKLLQTGESCAFSFAFTEYSDLTGKPPGFPQVKWCTSMGEFSIYRGDYTYPRGATSSSPNTGNNGTVSTSEERSIRFECLTWPGDMYVGEEEEVVIRVYNSTPQAMSVHLDCKNSSAQNPTGNTSSSKVGNSIRPRLSTTATSSGVSYANVLTAPNPVLSTPRSEDPNGVGSSLGGSSAGSGMLQYTHRGLSFSGLTFTPLGVLETGDFIDVTVRVYATSPGLHNLPTLYLIDSIKNDRHPIVSACRILVLDSEEEEDNDDDGSQDDMYKQKTETAVLPHYIPTATPAVAPLAVSSSVSSSAAPSAHAAKDTDGFESFDKSQNEALQAMATLPSPPPVAPIDDTFSNLSATGAPPPPAAAAAAADDDVHNNNPVPMSADLAKFLEESAREMDELMSGNSPVICSPIPEEETGMDLV